MCLRLTFEEALLWRNKAAGLLAAAKKKAASIPCDPLLRTLPRLSALVSEVDGVKKRHGLLLEQALIFAIDKLPNWSAGKEEIRIHGGKAQLDCLAFNEATGELLVFECKRGHGSFDADKVRAIDERLRKVSASIASHAASKKWSPSSVRVFILSFYGKPWRSAFTIHDARSIASVFEPCVGGFMREYMKHIESSTARVFAGELRDAAVPPDGDTIFDRLDEFDPLGRPDIVFTEDGAVFST